MLRGGGRRLIARRKSGSEGAAEAFFGGNLAARFRFIGFPVGKVAARFRFIGFPVGKVAARFRFIGFLVGNHSTRGMQGPYRSAGFEILASRWFFQSLRFVKAAKPSGKRPEVERQIRPNGHIILFMTIRGSFVDIRVKYFPPLSPPAPRPCKGRGGRKAGVGYEGPGAGSVNQSRSPLSNASLWGSRCRCYPIADHMSRGLSRRNLRRSLANFVCSLLRYGPRPGSSCN